MKNENEKKGLLERLLGSKKEKKGSCCCNFEVEEIPEENDNKKESQKAEGDGKSCCK